MLPMSDKTLVKVSSVLAKMKVRDRLHPCAAELESEGEAERKWKFSGSWR